MIAMTTLRALVVVVVCIPVAIFFLVCFGIAIAMLFNEDVY
jgi:hypothetical protein